MATRLRGREAIELAEKNGCLLSVHAHGSEPARDGVTLDEARRIALTLSMEDVAGDLVAPLLIVFGRLDRLIPWENATRLRDATGGLQAPVLILDPRGGAGRPGGHKRVQQPLQLLQLRH